MIKMQVKRETLNEPRMARGYGILLNGAKITQLDSASFLVPSQSKNVRYLVQRLTKAGVANVQTTSSGLSTVSIFMLRNSG